jgi:hypothetical protein
MAARLDKLRNAKASVSCRKPGSLWFPLSRGGKLALDAATANRSKRLNRQEAVLA